MTDKELRLECMRLACDSTAGSKAVEYAREYYDFISGIATITAERPRVGLVGNPEDWSRLSGDLGGLST